MWLHLCGGFKSRKVITGLLRNYPFSAFTAIWNKDIKAKTWDSSKVKEGPSTDFYPFQSKDQKIEIIAIKRLKLWLDTARISDKNSVKIEHTQTISLLRAYLKKLVYKRGSRVCGSDQGGR